MPRRRVLSSTRDRVLFVLACMAAGSAVALLEPVSTTQPHEVWPMVGVAFVGVTLTWDGRGIPGRATWRLQAALAAVLVVVALMVGTSPGSAVLTAATTVAGALAMGGTYRLFQREGGWAPDTPQAVFGLAVAAFLSGALVGLAGGFPGLDALSLDDRLTWWWAIRNGVFCFIGGVTFVELFHRPRTGLPRAPVWMVLALAPVSILGLVLSFADPELPLTWILIIPAVWAGSTLTPRGAALHSLAVGLGAAVMAYLPADRYDYAGLVAPSLIMDLCLSAATLVAMQLAIARGDRLTAIATAERERSAAARQADLLGHVFDEMSDGLIIHDPDGGVARSNPAARQLIGVSIPHRAAAGWAARLGLTDMDGSPLEDRDLPGTPGREADSVVVRIADGGSGRVLRIRSRPLAQDTGGHTVLLSDLTAQHARVEELTRFAGTVAHDLRSPIASLNGWLELSADCLEVGEHDKVGDFLARARSSAQRLEQVVSDWMAYTVSREGSIEPERIDLARTLGSLAASYASDDEHGPELVLDVPMAVSADGPLTRQLFANLIGNAVKFARPGTRPHVRITARPDEEPGWVRVEVHDRGIGLPPGEEGSIFEEFRRASGSEHVQGSGLGLALCRSIVRRHGGTIAARTNEDGGATISLTLPAAD